MLKISIKDFGAEEAFEIVENDEGAWKLMPYVGETACVHLLGYGGENVLTIHFMPMQDGSASALVVHSVCDNPIRAKLGRMARPANGLRDSDKHLTSLINALIADVVVGAWDEDEEQL